MSDKSTQAESRATARRLDEFEREAKAGAPDEWLAKKAECTIYAVRKWRRDKGIVRKRGAPAQQLEKERFAMSLVNRPVEDVLMRTSDSPVDGQWEPPVYLVRTELSYSDLVRQLHYLHRRGGFSVEAISAAHGYTLKTVQQAIALADHMEEENV